MLNFLGPNLESGVSSGQYKNMRVILSNKSRVEHGPDKSRNEPTTAPVNINQGKMFYKMKVYWEHGFDPNFIFMGTQFYTSTILY